MATLKAAHTELAAARYQFEKVAERKQRSVMRYMCGDISQSRFSLLKPHPPPPPPPTNSQRCVIYFSVCYIFRVTYTYLSSQVTKEWIALAEYNIGMSLSSIIWCAGQRFSYNAFWSLYMNVI